MCRIVDLFRKKLYATPMYCNWMRNPADFNNSYVIANGTTTPTGNACFVVLNSLPKPPVYFASITK